MMSKNRFEEIKGTISSCEDRKMFPYGICRELIAEVERLKAIEQRMTHTGDRERKRKARA